MEHQNSPQQSITKPLALNDETEMVKVKNEQKKVVNSYFIRELIQRHPRLVLLGASAFLLFAIYSSIVSIFQIGALKEDTGTTSVVTANTSNPNTSPASSDNSLSSWLLGVIVIGGAVGGVTIAKRLSKSSSELSQFFLQFHSSHQQKQFPPSRQSILSLPALKLSEPKPTWAESSMETESELKIHSETDEFIILIEEDSADEGEENFFTPLELTAEEKSLVFENITFAEISESSSATRSPVEDMLAPEIGSNSVPENEVYSPRSRSLAEMLDLRQKLSLATLLEIDK